MTPETKAELLRLVEAGDCYGAMLLTCREWAKKYHPEIKKGSAVFEMGDGRMLTLPILSSAETASESSPKPLSVPRSPRP